jgi:Skp family chaperone for outer membrane proteins
MARTSSWREMACSRFIAAGVAAMAMVLGLGVFSISAAQEAPTVEVWDFGVVPRPSLLAVLLDMEPVQQELKLTEAQKKEQGAIITRQQREMQKKMQQARRDTKEREKIQEAQAAIAKEFQAAIRTAFQPEQWERLDQIQLQAQGSLAFARPENGPWSAMAYVGPPLAERLKLSDDQVKRIRTIVEEGDKEITKAASFTIPVDPKEKPSTTEAIRKLVESPEYQAAKQKARQAGRDAGAAVIRRIEEVLTEPQRQAYHKMIGAPFDLFRLKPWGEDQERQIDVNMAARALGVGGAQGGGGQRADPNFNTKVARPAYASGPRHPRVLFDEAHHNFHTASGRYKPFAELITSDGYQVIPNGEKFTRAVLQKGDILVIANALGAEGMGQEGASNPAFTDAECDAVRDWVKDGGALLLITDHAPMGAAAQCLAKRFGVSLSTGAVGDPKNSEGGETFLVFSRQNHLLGDHPITRGRDDSERVNKVQTFTGTSLKGPEGSVPILKLAETAVDHSFDDDNKEVSAAGRTQGLAFPFGQGRVVVMGEAAELSAQVIGADEKFGMNVPGIDNRQMALNILHWLSGLLEPREAALKKAG